MTARSYDLLAELLEYPGPSLLRTAEVARSVVGARNPEAALAVEAFAAWAATADPADAEELYTATFDLQAPCCLELGWQLGETYKRGWFLVKMSQAARAHQVERGTELADHLAVVLRLLARLPGADNPRGLVEEVMLPGLDKMLAGLPASANNPYRQLLHGTRALLASDWHASAVAIEARLPVLQAEVEP